MLPTQYFPANGSESDRNLTMQMARFASEASSFYFTIAQPDGPGYKVNNRTWRPYQFKENATDISSAFRLNTGISRDQATDQGVQRAHEKHLREYLTDDLNSKWKIGVGVGVGLGVPLISAIVAGFAYKAGVKRGSPQGRIVSSDK